MKNTETTDKKSRVLSAIGGINDEFILEAAPTGRHEKRSRRGPIAAAIGTAAAAAVVLIAVFGGKGKPSEPVQQVQASEKPVMTTEAPATQAHATEHSAVTRTISLGKATNAKEWAELAAESSVVTELKEQVSAYMFGTSDSWSPPTPESILLSTDTGIFRGVVREVENRRITIVSTDTIANTGSGFDIDFCIVTFDVTECYKGSLAAGEQTRVFFDTCICPLAEIEPPIGEKGSGMAYFTQLSPGTEVIAVVKECGNEEFITIWQDKNNDPFLSFSAPYRDYAECRFKNDFGKLFLQSDDGFFYDVDVYDTAMLGENPSMDSAESYIRGLLSGLEL